MTFVPDKIEMEPLKVSLQSVSLRRGERVLFENLSLTLKPGNLLYVLGENGIGKTSLLLALAGLLKPSQGQISFSEGSSPFFSSSLIVQPDGASRGLSVLEELRFTSDIYAANPNFEHLLEKVDLMDVAQNRTETLSLGQRKRLSLAKLLIARRSLWLLDEPFSALDASGRGLFSQEIAAHLGQGGIAVIATHLPTDILGHSAKTLTLEVAK